MPEPRDRIVERVGRPWLVEAVRLLEAGQGSVIAIDEALEAAGYAQGPLRRLDAVGLDVDLAIGEELAETWPAGERFLAPDLQRDLVAAGRTGRVVGRGFYRYLPDGSAAPDVAVRLDSLLDPQAIVERLELAVVNEAYRAVADGLAGPPAIDAALRAGAGFPRGPFQIVDELGLRRVVQRLRVLHAETRERSGEQYAVAQLLWQMATA